jgi:hypothetical protein
MEESQGYGTSLLSFLQAFGARWFIAMSGPLTVPFAILALILETRFQKVLFGVLAGGCAFFAAYWVWKRERNALRAAHGELDEERAKNAVAAIRTSINCVRLSHGLDIRTAVSNCTFFLNVVVWNESPMAATIRVFKCSLIAHQREYSCCSLPVGDFVVAREVLEHGAWEPKVTTVEERLNDLSASNESPITNIAHREGWLRFQFRDLPVELTQRKILEHGQVRLTAVDNRGNAHQGEPWRIVPCDDRLHKAS